MNSTVKTPRIAPSFPLSPADRATQRAASYVRPSANLTTCPECQEAYSGAHHCRPKVTGLSSAGREALRRSYAATQRIKAEQIEAAYAEYAAQPSNEYEEWATGVAA